MHSEPTSQCPERHDRIIGEDTRSDGRTLVITKEYHDKICLCTCTWCKKPEIETDAIRLFQGGRSLYIFSLSAATIRDLILSGKMDVDRWGPDNPDGYQRAPSPTRYKKFAKYVVENNRLCPTSLLLSLRDQKALSLKDADPRTNTVHITISLSSAKLYIFDGQHRAFGLEWAASNLPDAARSYELPAILEVVSQVDPRYEEAKHFYVINSNSKPIRTDLAQRFILRRQERENGEIRLQSIVPEATWLEQQPYAVRIADCLNEAGALCGRIASPNALSVSASISQSSFIDSLKPLLHMAAEMRWTVGFTVKVLNSFWGALRDRCPLSFNHWSKDSCSEQGVDHFNAVLTTTSGMYSLNDILSRLLLIPNVAVNPASEHTFSEILSRPSVQEYFVDGPDGYWGNSTLGAGSHGTSRKSFMEIAEDIWYGFVET